MLAPESTTNSRSSDFVDAAGIIHFSEGEQNVALSFFELVDFLGKFPRISAAHRSCLAVSLPEICP